MNLHEYQGKSLLKNYGVTVPEGILANTPEEAVKAAETLHSLTDSNFWVVKAQIHAGGRGKGGGVKLAKSYDEVYNLTSKMIGMMLVTPQTKAGGKKVNKVLIQQDVYYPGNSETREFYMSIMLDRSRQQNMILYSPRGGMDIEAVAEETPDQIFKEYIDHKVGILEFQCRRIAFNLGLQGEPWKAMVKFVCALYKAYVSTDATLFEINPVLKTSDDKILAVDCKVTIDNNALFRHPYIIDMRDLAEEDPMEVEADYFGLNYVKLDGNVGCMVNGAGLAMATMDMIKLSGGEPANFLDVGGTANAQTVEAGFRIILKDPKVKAILINIFGGIVRCDRVAQGIVDAYKNIGDIKVPIIVRLQGTNAEEAKKIIEESGLKVYPAVKLEEAAALVTKLVNQ